jgi:probable O-glycosylation ligase (exosortase A-associated)
MAIRNVGLLLFFVFSVPACFFKPFYGVLLWTVVAFLNPQAFIWSREVFPWALSVGLATMAGSVFFCRAWKALSSLKVLLMVVLWVWFTVTSMASTTTPLFMHHAGDTWYKWQFVSKIMLMAVVSIPLVDTFSKLRTFVLVIAGCFGVFVLKTFPFVISTGGAFRLYGPENSMIADNNDFGLALNMTAPLFFFLAQTEANRWVRRFFGFLFLITIPSVFFTYSRGALVGLIAVMGLMFLQSKQRLILIPVITMATIVALMFAPDEWKHRMDPTRPDALDNSAKERLNAWAFATNLASEYPITGGGFATFTPELFGRYAPVALDIHGPHSVYFQVLGEHGYVGLSLYLALVLTCFAGAHRLVREARSYQDREVIHYANMFRFSMIGFLSSGAFLGRAYFDYFFSLVACLAILDTVARDRWAQGIESDGELDPALAANEVAG